MNPIQLTKQYFTVSNNSDFTEIEKLFATNSTYSSQNTWLYLWVDNIIAMQTDFHKSFEKLEWKVQTIEEEKPWIVRVDFDFEWVKDGEKIVFSGIEYLVVVEGKIQHIEIKNK